MAAAGAGFDTGAEWPAEDFFGADLAAGAAGFFAGAFFAMGFLLDLAMGRIGGGVRKSGFQGVDAAGADIAEG